jgi:hypothetical protein
VNNKDYKKLAKDGIDEPYSGEPIIFGEQPKDDNQMSNGDHDSANSSDN